MELDAHFTSIDLWESERLNLIDQRLPLAVQLGARASARYQQKPTPSLTFSGMEWIVPTAAEMKDALIDLTRDAV